MIMRTSSGSPSTTGNSRDASDSGSGNSSGVVNTPTVQPTAPLPGAEHLGKFQKAVVTTQVAVQGDEPAIQKRMPTIKKIPQTVGIVHALLQEQVPNIAKTDEIPQAQFMPRRCTTTRCAETVPNIQEIQKTG